MSEFEIQPPFGTYALPPKQERWRQRAKHYNDSKFGRAMISFCRKRAIAAHDGPFDVEVHDTIKARLYPNDNRTEKRALAGPQIWEAAERQHIQAAIQSTTQDKFVFIDAGANVGLYALYADMYARRAGIDTQILAIEPSPETLIRLRTNIAASQANITIIETALSDYTGKGQLTPDMGNRGEIKLAANTPADKIETAQSPVRVDTLHNVCTSQNVDHINVLKMDIEDHEEVVLRAFFETASAALHPEMLIVETRRAQAAAPLIELCRDHNYLTAVATRQNSVLVKNTHV